MKCGAENSTANVAIIVNNVKIIRHNRSTTMAANFQSRVMSPVSSSFFSCLIKKDFDFKLYHINKGF